MQGSWLFSIVVLGLVGGFPTGTARAAELTVPELTEGELSEMEQLLARLNFDPGAVDGKVDDRTRTAIRLYQEFAILPVNGEPSAQLLRELRQVSLVYAEMRAASPDPEPEPELEITTPAESDPDPAPAVEVAAAEPSLEAAPEIPEPPAEAAPVAEMVEPEPEPEVAEPVALVPESEVAVAEPTEPVVETAVAEPGPEMTEAVEPESEPEPLVAEPEPEVTEAVVEPESEPEPAVAEPEPEVTEAVEPESEPELTVAEPVPDAELTAAEPELAVATPADPTPEAAPEAAPEAVESPTEPGPEPEPVAQFSIAGMIARLKERDHVDAPAVSAEATPTTTSTATLTAIPTTPADRAGQERTLIWKVQQELRRVGLDPGAADGNLRTRTTGAIATYQRARGLTADGRVSEELLARLEAETTPAAPQPSGDTSALATVSPQAAAIDAAPNNGYQAFRAGYSAARAGDFGAAVKLYDQAIDGGDLALEHLAAALYNRANAYQYLGATDKAIEDYSAAIANKPGFPAAYYNRGFALDKKGEQVRAVEDFRKARDLGLQRLGVRSPDLPPPLL